LIIRDLGFNPMQRALIIFITFFICLFLPKYWILAHQPYEVVINEIAWMGTQKSWSNEWIELYNNTNKSINLSGWVIKAEDEKLRIELEGVILPSSFFLLERSDDQALPEIKADLIYKGGLNNAGEKISFFDKSGNLIDEIDCSTGWFAGNNLTKQTMERVSPNSSGSDPKNWQTSKLPGGTPKEKNSKLKDPGDLFKAQIVNRNLSFWQENKKFFSVLIKGLLVALFLTIIGFIFRLKVETIINDH
jgi:hypothetical protein